MGLWELLMIAAALSMDAFAVALSKGLNMHKLNFRHTFVLAAFFGGFQAAMPLLGWLLGIQFEQYITSFDHWIAFALLAMIGGKMLLEAFNKDGESSVKFVLNIKELLLLAIATSIDALAAGITFAFLNVSILSAIALIGSTTFIFSASGVIIGNRFGLKYKGSAEILGGLVLISIGIKILLEHMNLL